MTEGSGEPPPILSPSYLKTAIAVFLKYPEPGKVKTRLAKDIGEEKAIQIYSRMVEHIATQVLLQLPPEHFEVIFFCDPFMPLASYQFHFREYPFPLHMQKGADLGMRLRNAFGSLLPGHSQVVAIGTDCIDLTPSLLLECREELAQGQDIVLGPTEDGGYYLIGLKQLHDPIFDGVAWSTDSVLRDTLGRVAALNLKPRLLKTLRDIDTVNDLEGTIFGKG